MGAPSTLVLGISLLVLPEVKTQFPDVDIKSFSQEWTRADIPI